MMQEKQCITGDSYSSFFSQKEERKDRESKIYLNRIAGHSSISIFHAFLVVDELLRHSQMVKTDLDETPASKKSSFCDNKYQ